MFDIPSALTAIKTMHKMFSRDLRGNKVLELETAPEGHFNKAQSRTVWLLIPA